MKKTSKKTKIIIPALATLLLTSVASVSSTVAWFMNNTSVKATGMSFSAKAGSNLLIASSSGSDKTIASSFSTSITQTFSNIKLAPVSSVDGKNFYSLEKGTVDSTGTATSASFTQQTTTTEATGTGEAYALDYVFQLKATNTSSSTQYIYIKELKLTSPTSNNAYKAFRVATFVESSTTNTTNTAVTEGTTTGFTANNTSTAKAIYAPENYAYQTPTSAINDADGNKASVSIISSASEDNCLAKVETTTNLAKYYKVWVRLWLEGEDKSCITSLFENDGTWNLEVTVDMNSSLTDGASNITSATTAA